MAVQHGIRVNPILKEEAVKGSLKRLGIDHIDLYQLHGGTIDDPLDETISAFDELKQERIIHELAYFFYSPKM